MSDRADPSPPLTSGRLAEMVGGTLSGAADVAIAGINSIERAGADEVTIISESKYARGWAASRAGAALVSEAHLSAADSASDGRPLIAVPDAQNAAIVLLEYFSPGPVMPAEGVHPTAWVHPHASLGGGVRIGPHVSVDRGAIIGDGVVLHPGTRVYPEATIGTESVVHGNGVVRERCRLGRRVTLGPGGVIGGTGFGYRPAEDGASLIAVPHIGTVEIADDVEIGANSCVDRGKFGATEIGAGTKIDNLVQVGHNCRVGRHCVFAAGVMIGGSTVVGDWVQIGGAAALIDHISIGDGARIAGKSAVTRDVRAGEAVFGYPADTAHRALRQVACVRKLPDLFRKLSQTAHSDRR